MVSGPQRLQPSAWTAPDLSTAAPALDSAARRRRLPKNLFEDLNRRRLPKKLVQCLLVSILVMDLFEYQGKQYFARFGIPVSPGGVADTVDEAVAQAGRVGYPVVVKAQVQVGGRGKAGGIKLASNADELKTHAKNILGMDIKGHAVHRVWIERASDIAHDYYASFTLDRGARMHLGMVSARGGIDIEQVAAEDPEAIARLHIDPVTGLSEKDARGLVEKAGLDKEAHAGAVDILQKLYRC